MPWFFSRRRFLDLEERQEKLERDLRGTLLEAQDLYEKARRALGRAVKREQLDNAESAPVGEVPAGAATGELSARLRAADPVSRRILQERARKFPVAGGSQ